MSCPRRKLTSDGRSIFGVDHHHAAGTFDIDGFRIGRGDRSTGRRRIRWFFAGGMDELIGGTTMPFHSLRIIGVLVV